MNYYSVHWSLIQAIMQILLVFLSNYKMFANLFVRHLFLCLMAIAVSYNEEIADYVKCAILEIPSAAWDLLDYYGFKEK